MLADGVRENREVGGVYRCAEGAREGGWGRGKVLEVLRLETKGEYGSSSGDAGMLDKEARRLLMISGEGSLTGISFGDLVVAGLRDEARDIAAGAKVCVEMTLDMC